MNHIGKLIAVAALAFAMSALSNEAQADFKVRLDNNPNNGTVANVSTQNYITVCATFTINLFFCWDIDSRVLNSSPGNHDYEYIGFEEVEDIYAIGVWTDGSDMFWLDQFELFDENNVKVWTSGGDNTHGWCISTDPGDGEEDWCEDPAYEWKEFIVEL